MHSKWPEEIFRCVPYYYKDNCFVECVTVFVFLLQARQTVSALHQQQEEEENHNSQQRSGSNWGHGSATAELLRIKDHLIDVEKNVRFSFCSSRIKTLQYIFIHHHYYHDYIFDC